MYSFVGETIPKLRDLFTRKTYLLFLLVYIVSALIFIAHYCTVGSGVWGDSRYYYSYLHSAIIDGNFQFEDEAVYFQYPVDYTAKGYVINKFSIGPSLFWLPFFTFAHLVSLLISAVNIPLAVNGYSHVYQLAVGLAAVGYGIVGLWLCFLVNRQYVDVVIALLSTLGLYFASNLFFYIAIDPINSHAVSFFTASLLFYFYHRYHTNTYWYHFFIMGIMVGLLGMIRTQDLIFGALPFLTAISSKDSIHRRIIHGLGIGAGVVLAFTPQIILWHNMFGELRSPYLTLGETFNWFNPQLLSVLISSQNGLLFYSPILIGSFAGLWLLTKQKSKVAYTGILLLLIQLYVVASWHSWWGGEAYGGRMFISLLPFCALGLGAVINYYKNKVAYVLCLVVVLSGLNMAMILQYLLTH